MAYSFVKSITINHTKVAANLTNFPVLFSGTYTYLRTVGNGGDVQNASGFDIIISSTSNLDGSGIIDFERVIYTAASGLVEIWFKAASLSSSVDTVFYLLYGNSGISTDQSNPTGVWDSNFKAVFHLPDGSSLTADDSTSNGNDGTVNGSMAAGTGLIDGAAVGAQDDTKYISTSYVPPTSDFTYSGWVKSSARQLFNRAYGSSDFLTGLTGAGFAYGWKIGDNPFAGTDSIYVIFRQGSNVTTGDISYSPAGLTNDWMYIAIRMHSTNGGSLCINGTQVATNSAYTSITLGGLTFTIGKDPNQNQGSLGGSVDEVHVSDVVRSTDWLTTEYNNQNDPSTFYTITDDIASVTRTAADALVLSDSIIVLGLDPFLQAEIGDPLPLFDSMSAIGDGPKEFSDALSFSDAIEVAKIVPHELSDALSLSDAVTLSFITQILIADLLQLTDRVHIALDQKLEILVQDSLVLTDNPLTAAAWQASLSDALSLSDAIVVLRELAFSDSLSLSDAATTLLESIFLDVQRTVDDELQLFDSIQLSANTEGHLFGDSLPLSDSVGVVFNSNPTDYLRRYLNDVRR